MTRLLLRPGICNFLSFSIVVILSDNYVISNSLRSIDFSDMALQRGTGEEFAKEVRNLNYKVVCSNLELFR